MKSESKREQRKQTSEKGRLYVHSLHKIKLIWEKKVIWPSEVGLQEYDSAWVKLKVLFENFSDESEKNFLIPVNDLGEEDLCSWKKMLIKWSVTEKLKQVRKNVTNQRKYKWGVRINKHFQMKTNLKQGKIQRKILYISGKSQRVYKTMRKHVEIYWRVSSVIKSSKRKTVNKKLCSLLLTKM